MTNLQPVSLTPTAPAELLEKFAPGVVDTGDKFVASVIDTDGIFATGVVDTGDAP
jgi:hypothetical protein